MKIYSRRGETPREGNLASISLAYYDFAESLDSARAIFKFRFRPFNRPQCRCVRGESQLVSKDEIPQHGSRILAITWVPSVTAGFSTEQKYPLSTFLMLCLQCSILKCATQESKVSLPNT